MIDSSGQFPKWWSASVAAMLALLIVLPSLRAYLPSVPRAIHFLPMVVLLALSLSKNFHFTPLKIPRLMALFVSLSTLFCLLLMLSSVWTISTIQYQTDLVLLATNLILLLTYPTVLDQYALRIFFRIICFWAGLVVFIVIGEFVLLGSLKAEGTFLYDRYLTIAHILGLAATGASIRYLVPGSNSRIWGVVSLFLFLGLALSLGRGALLTALFILALSALGILLYQYFSSSRTVNWPHELRKIGTTFFLLCGTIVLALQVGRTRVRLLRLFSGTEMDEGGRGPIWREALNNIQDSPWFGFGLSSSGPLSAGSEAEYPHNLFLQVWLDGGVGALILLLVVLGLPLVSFIRFLWRRRPENEALLFPLAGMYFFLFLEYCKSDNFYTARGLFLMGFCVMMLAENWRPGIPRPKS